MNGELLPHLRSLHEQPGATPRQKVISQIMSGVERTRIDTERNFRDILDKVHEISNERVDETHVFTLSQVYAGSRPTRPPLRKPRSGSPLWAERLGISEPALTRSRKPSTI